MQEKSLNIFIVFLFYPVYLILKGDKRMPKCNNCCLEFEDCICNEVEEFFEDSWDLMKDESWKTVPPGVFNESKDN